MHIGSIPSTLQFRDMLILNSVQFFTFLRKHTFDTFNIIHFKINKIDAERVTKKYNLYKKYVSVIVSGLY